MHVGNSTLSFRVLAEVLPETEPVYKSLQANRKLWVGLKREGRKNSDPPTE